MELNIVKQIIAEVLKVDVREISKETTLVLDLGADSLDIMRILMNIEEKFGLIIDKKAINQIETVNDVLNLIK